MIDYHTLSFWQRGHQLTQDVYRLSRIDFPQDERFGLTAQVRRAAVSIGSNIAEGTGRRSTKELNRFLMIAAGSCSEVQYQLELARDLEFISPGRTEPLIETAIEVRRTIYSYADKL